MGSALAASVLAGCSTSDIQPLPDPDLEVVATWGSIQSERSWNGAALDADASLLPTNGVRVACHDNGCFVGISSNERIDGPGLEGAVSDAVLAFDGAGFAPLVASSHDSMDFVLDALAAAANGEHYVLGGRFTKIDELPVSPFGASFPSPGPDGSLLARGNAGGGLDEALWLLRGNFDTSTPVYDQLPAPKNAAWRAVIGGLAMPLSDPGVVVLGLRFRDEVFLVDDAPADPHLPLLPCAVPSSGSDTFRWGALYAAQMAGAAPECDLIEARRTSDSAGIFLEVLTIATAGDLVLHAGHYVDPKDDAAKLTLDTDTELPALGGSAFIPFVARSELSISAGDPDNSLDFAEGLAVPGALEAAAMRSDGSWLACGVVNGEPVGDVPESCRGVAPGDWLVVHGRFGVEGCVNLGIPGRCRAATISPAGFVIAGIAPAADGWRSTLVEMSPLFDVLRQVDRPGLLIDTLDLRGEEIFVGGSFTGTLDQQEPRGGTSDWDLLLARLKTP